MKTDENTPFNFSFGQIFKMSLAIGFGLFGGAQLISGYWALGFISCSLGAIFAKDSLELVRKLFEKKPDQSNSSTQNLVMEPKKESKKEDTIPKPVVFSDKKQKNQSESRHKAVPTLNLAGSLERKNYTPLALSDSDSSTPGSNGLTRKKPAQRLSQKPTVQEMQTVRAMTEDEVAFLFSQPSPKQVDQKETIKPKITKK